MKVLTVEIEDCSDCTEFYFHLSGFFCRRTAKEITTKYGDFPEWCPLPSKEENNV